MHRLFLVLSLVLFLVGLLYVLTTDAIDNQTASALLFGGLASFAAGHIPWPWT